MWRRRQAALRTEVKLKQLQRKRNKSEKDVACMKKLAAQASRPPAGLADALRRVVVEADAGAGGLPIVFVNAPHQADSQLAHLCLTHDIDAVYSSDSDILILGCPLLIREGCNAVPGLPGKVGRGNVVAASFSEPERAPTPSGLSRSQTTWSSSPGDCAAAAGGVGRAARQRRAAGAASRTAAS